MQKLTLNEYLQTLPKTEDGSANINSITMSDLQKIKETQTVFSKPTTINYIDVGLEKILLPSQAGWEIVSKDMFLQKYEKIEGINGVAITSKKTNSSDFIVISEKASYDDNSNIAYPINVKSSPEQPIGIHFPPHANGEPFFTNGSEAPEGTMDISSYNIEKEKTINSIKNSIQIKSQKPLPQGLTINEQIASFDADAQGAKFLRDGVSGLIKGTEQKDIGQYNLKFNNTTYTVDLKSIIANNEVGTKIPNLATIFNNMHQVQTRIMTAGADVNKPNTTVKGLSHPIDLEIQQRNYTIVPTKVPPISLNAATEYREEQAKTTIASKPY